MNALTEIGEIGISTARHDYLLRPSFRAMASLGNPAEIVQIFHDLHTLPSALDRLYLAERVICACLVSGKWHRLLGYTNEHFVHVAGEMPEDHKVPIAIALMRHGIVGVIPKKTYVNDGTNYTPEFVAKDYAAIAMAQLGVSEHDAWNMTMTSFAAAMRAKFGEPEQKTPSIEEHDEAMRQLEEINRLRGFK